MKFRYLLILVVPYWSINAYGNYCANYSLFDKKPLSLDDTAAIEADTSSVENKNTYRLMGNASLVSPDYALQADQITINKELKIASSSGNVKFNDQNTLLTSQNLEITKKENSNFIKANSAEYALPDQNIRGSAATLSGTSDLKTFNNAIYTKCPVGNLNWNIDAESIVLNSKTNRGKAKNAVLKLHGVPVVYTPSVEWVLNGKGSGFLAPSYSSYSDDGTSKKGYSVNIPYFLNIAPDRDVLLGLNHLSTRGENLTAKYRQLIYDNSLWQEGRLESEMRYLDNDDISNEDRWLLDNRINLSLNRGADLTLVNRRVSDKDYFKEIALEGSSKERLISSIDLKHQSNLFTTNIYSEAEQVVNSASSDYTRNLEVNLSKSLNIGDKINLGLSNSYTDFDHKSSSSSTGARNHLKLSLNKNFQNLAYEVKPSISFLNTQYNLDDSSSVNRSLYAANLDSKLFLERELDFSDQEYIQTLVPRLNFTYIPKKNQSSIPNFDSESLNSSYDALFSGESFTGFDKVSNQNSLTFGLESDFINDNSGETLLSLKAAQKFYLDDELMNSSGNFEKTSDSDRGYSNIETSVDFNKGVFNFNNSLSLNPDSKKVVRSSSGIKFNFSPKSFGVLQFIDDNDVENIRFNGSFELNNSNHIFWNAQKNLTTNIMDRLTLGIAKEDCCIAYRFAFFKKNLSSKNYSYDRAFEIVFKGLSSTTPSLRRRIEAEIPDYIGDLDNNL